jgi:hypothetical protein
MIQYKGGNGSTKEKAIEILGAKDNQDGIDAEYNFIEELFGEYELVLQSFLQEENKCYDQLEIKSVAGNYIFWFDITDFYGK